MAARHYGQYCGITRAVELVGERWALLIVRDLLVGPRRYTDLKHGLPRIPTNILAARLRELQEGGVVHRVPLAGGGLVYELTPYGRELEPILIAMGRWGFQAMGDPAEGDVVTPDSLTMALRTSFRESQAEPLDIELHVGDVALRVQVHGGTLHVAPLAPDWARAGSTPPEAAVEAVIVAGPGIRRLIGGEVTPAEALRAGLLAVVRGEEKALDRFSRTFYIAPIPAADAPWHQHTHSRSTP